MKKVAKVLAVIALSIGVFVGVIFMLTSGLPKVANQFFEDIKNGNIEAAYDLTDSIFQASTTFAEFETGVENLNLNNYKDASWTNRSVSSDEFASRGELEGTISFTDGTSSPACMQFFKDDGEWRINFFGLEACDEEVNTGDSTTGNDSSLEIPSKDELITMANTAMGVFADAVSQGDFTDFYENTISEGWREETTVADLNESFKDFLEPPVIDMAPIINSTTPIFGEPTIDEYGWLIVKGRYSSEDLTLEFELDYTEENGEWALSGIAVSTR